MFEPFNQAFGDARSRGYNIWFRDRRTSVASCPGRVRTTDVARLLSPGGKRGENIYFGHRTRERTETYRGVRYSRRRRTRFRYPATSLTGKFDVLLITCSRDRILRLVSRSELYGRADHRIKTSVAISKGRRILPVIDPKTNTD